MAKEVFRTQVEEVFLRDMVADDRLMIAIGESETAVDSIVPANTAGLFDDTSSDDSLEDLLDDDYDELF